ncbi:MAG: tRNA glutamyl-Q(34) synthetase GluQRS [Alphaproteobacteria bacterium]|nr:tRNA glutamyl-Q(34) synthetase GluQRS [Alphaproteobacteria bacterium]
MIVTRFAPSPTGYLHLGHAFSALLAAQEADVFLLRIENIDPVRCKPEFEDAIKEDLSWLGLRWEQPIRRQSEHIKDYQDALTFLREEGLVYPCFCSRRDVEREAQKAGLAPHADDGTVVYSGTCRNLSKEERTLRLDRGESVAWRLDMAKAVERTGALFWHDRLQGKIKAQPELFGDVVLARKDVPTSYHLSVTVDDHLQEITRVTRGQDLFASTHIHRLLQALLGYQTPEYSHHRLLLDPCGRRYAKRHHAVALRVLREKGVDPAALRADLLGKK